MGRFLIGGRAGEAGRPRLTLKDGSGTQERAVVGNGPALFRFPVRNGYGFWLWGAGVRDGAALSDAIAAQINERQGTLRSLSRTCWHRFDKLGDWGGLGRRDPWAGLGLVLRVGSPCWK